MMALFALHCSCRSDSKQAGTLIVGKSLEQREINLLCGKTPSAQAINICG